MHMLIAGAILSTLAFATTDLAAQAPYADAPESPRDEAPLDEVVVTGEFPGPGLWKVTRPDDASGHALWIIGDPGYLPKGITWKSKEVEAIVAGSQEILVDAGFSLTTDEKVGIFRGMTYLPAALKASRNPGEATLKDLLPADLYARWQVEKKRLLGRDRGVERWRPMFAANKLRQAAIDDLGVRKKGVIWQAIEDIVKSSKIEVNKPLLKFTFKRDELRARIRQFAKESAADTECFATTLDLTETLADRDLENARARAWAVGDIDALASLPARPDPNLPCAMAFMNMQAARDLVPADISRQLFDLWIAEAERSLVDNQSTFAVLPFGKLTREDGYLSALREKGYVVETPR